MHVKKVTQKDRYGNQTSYEFEVPEKGVDQTKLMEKAMELGIPPMTDMSMDMEMSMGDPMSHPGGPRGSDTVPAWLTPGEFVVNAEAMSIPGVEEQITDINNAGRAMQQGGMAMGYQQGGKVAKAIGQLVAQQKEEVPFIAGPMLTDEAMYRADGGGVPMPVPMLDALLHSREGYRDDVYLDSLGKPTVGAGHLLPNEYKERVGERPFTKEQLMSMFEEDKNKAAAEARANVGEDAWNKLNKRQQATMASMAFQLGGSGQRKFKNLLEAVKAGDYNRAAKEALTGSKGGKSKWLKQTPVRAMDLAEAFDPNVAAQYRAAGGAVYASDGGWGSWLKNAANKYVLGPNSQIPTPSELSSTPQLPIPYGWNVAEGRPYTQEEGIAAGTVAPPASIPDDSAYEQDLAQQIAMAENMVEGGDGDDLGTAQAGPSDAALAEMYGGVEDFGTGMGVPQENISVPQYNEMPTENDWRDEAGLLGDALQGLGIGDNTIAQIEHEERTDQQLRGAAADKALEIEDFETEAVELEEEAQAAINAGDYGEYARLRSESARKQAAAEAAKAEAGTIAEAQAKATDEHDRNAKKRGRAAATERLEELAKAHKQAKADGDDAAVAQIEGEMDNIHETQKQENAVAETDTTTKDSVVEKVIEDGAGQDGPDADQAGETVPPETVEETGKQNPGEVKKATGFLKGIFGDLFDGDELKRMAIMYAGSRLLGYGHAGSLRFAAKQYVGRVDAKSAQFDKLVTSGKYTPESLAAYKASGNIADLRAVGEPAKRTGNFKTFYKDGKPHRAEEVDIGGSKTWVTPSGTQIDATYADDPSTVPGTKEYSSRVKDYRSVTSQQLESMRSQFDRQGSGDETFYKTDINPHTSAGKIAEWAAKNNVDPNQLAGLVESAYHDALNDQRQDGSKARDLVPYLNQLVVRQHVGQPDAFLAKGYDGDGPKQYVDPEKLATLNQSISGLMGHYGKTGPVKDLANQFYDAALRDWNALGAEGQKEWNAKARDDESGFYKYAEHIVTTKGLTAAGG